MKQFKVGIQLYGVKHTMAKDFEGTTKEVKDTVAEICAKFPLYA